MSVSILSLSTSPTSHFPEVAEVELSSSTRRTRRRFSTHTLRSRPLAPKPGTRRFRRYLNSLVSADESEAEYYYHSFSEREDYNEEEQELEIIRFEWKGQFIEAGEEFFNNTTTSTAIKHSTQHDTNKHLGDRLQRKLERLERERKKQRQQRRLRKEQQPNLTTRSTVLSSTDSPSISSIHSNNDQQNELDQSSQIMMRLNLKGDDSDDSADDQLQFHAAPGQELAADLWLLMEKRVRSILKNMYDFQFLQQLEVVLNQFKNKPLSTSSTSSSTAASSYWASSHHFQVVSSPPHFHCSSDDELMLSFQDEFLCYLTCGITTFHLLYVSNPQHHSYSNQHFSSKQSLPPLIIKKRKGYIAHTASLEQYIKKHFYQRQ